jgi:hypothetical protein
VALPNISKFFKEQSDEEREQAQKFMKYQVERFYLKVLKKHKIPKQNTRGGRVVLQNVEKPDKDEWGRPLEVRLKSSKFVIRRIFLGLPSCIGFAKIQQSNSVGIAQSGGTIHGPTGAHGHWTLSNLINNRIGNYIFCPCKIIVRAKICSALQ